jgi:O-antigen ligase
MLSLVLLPVWWALALDQFIWMLVGPLVLLKVLIRNRWKLMLPRVHLLLLLFLASQLISAFFIVENERYITFARTFGAYIAAFCISLVLVQEIKSRRDVNLVLGVLLGVVGLAACLGLVASAGLVRPTFTAVLAEILPESLLRTNYGANLVNRQFGMVSWFSLFGEYYRLRSFFLYPTMYAAVLAFIIPFAAFYALTSWRWRIIRVAMLLLLALFVFNLLFTTGRIAMVALAGGFLLFLVKTSRFRILLRMLILCGGILALTVTAVVIWEQNELPLIASQSLNDFLLARGPGSFEDRTAIYRITLENVGERPVFGWGTERDVPPLYLYPAGSHSYYLGVLYKHGLVGLSIFVVMLWSLWRTTAPPKDGTRLTSDDRDCIWLLWYGRWAIISVLVIASTEVLDLDTTTLVFFWIIVGVLVSTRRLLRVSLNVSMQAVSQS